MSDTPSLELPTCDKTSSTLYNLMLMFIIPLIAAIYCIAQLFYRGIMGIEKLFDFKENANLYKLRRVFGYAVSLIVLFLFFPLLYAMFKIRLKNLQLLFN